MLDLDIVSQMEYHYCDGDCQPVRVGPAVFTTSAAHVLFVMILSLKLGLILTCRSWDCQTTVWWTAPAALHLTSPLPSSWWTPGRTCPTTTHWTTWRSSPSRTFSSLSVAATDDVNRLVGDKAGMSYGDRFYNKDRRHYSTPDESRKLMNIS